MFPEQWASAYRGRKSIVAAPNSAAPIRCRNRFLAMDASSASSVTALSRSSWPSAYAVAGLSIVQNLFFGALFRVGMLAPQETHHRWLARLLFVGLVADDQPCEIGPRIQVCLACDDPMLYPKTKRDSVD